MKKLLWLENEKVGVIEKHIAGFSFRANGNLILYMTSAHALEIADKDDIATFKRGVLGNLPERDEPSGDERLELIKLINAYRYGIPYSSLARRDKALDKVFDFFSTEDPVRRSERRDELAELVRRHSICARKEYEDCRELGTYRSEIWTDRADKLRDEILDLATGG